MAICGSGVGAAVCANKVPGVRASLIHDHFSAKQGLKDDHMNILCMGGRTVGPEVAWDLLQTFLAAQFSLAPRHLRRLSKAADLELGKPAEFSERPDRLDSLCDWFGQELTDPRDPRGVRHKLAALLTLSGLASAWSSNWPCPPTPTKRRPSPPICPTWIWREPA